MKSPISEVVRMPRGKIPFYTWCDRTIAEFHKSSRVHVTGKTLGLKTIPVPIELFISEPEGQYQITSHPTLTDAEHRFYTAKQRRQARS